MSYVYCNATRREQTLTLHNSRYSFLPTITYLPIVGLFMAVAAVIYWPLPELGFRSENSPVSWLSSAQLWALSVIAIRLSVERALPITLCLWIAIAMATLAFDEQFMFHEQWKYGCIDWFEFCRVTWVTEMPMLMVGACGVITAAWLHVTLPLGWARVQLWCAIGIGLFALSMDLFNTLRWLAEYEEGFEVIAEGCFISFLLGIRPTEKR